jgi:hypothetical protein
MATAIPEINLFLDYYKPGGVEPLLEEFKSKQVYSRQAFMSGDVCKIRLYFRKRGATAESDSTEETLPAGSTIVVAGRNSTDLTSALLFCANAFSEVTGLNSSKCYEATLDLNTETMLAAMTGLATTVTKITAVIDIEVRNAGNTSRVTYRTTIEIYRQVYAGEIAPSPLSLPPMTRTDELGGVWEIGVTSTGQTTWTKVA